MLAEIPSLSSLIRMFRAAWPDFMPEHRHWFSAGSLEILLKQHGFEVRYRATGGGSWAWLGGAARVLKRRTEASPRGNGHRMPGAVKMGVLRLGDVLLSPILLLERCFQGGSELRVIARKSR